VHKVSVVWDEDLRTGNGIFNMYYGFKTMDPRREKTKALIEYAHKALDATGVRNGASDIEVKWLEAEGTPCLVDLNARWTGLAWDDGLAIEKATTGNDQITATINAYLDGQAFKEMPRVPSMEQHGALVFPFNTHSGILTGVPGMAVAKRLPSYVGAHYKRAFVGKFIEKLNVSKAAITVLLAHKDEAVLYADYDRLIDLEYKDEFFDIAPLPQFRAAHADVGGPSDFGRSALPALVVLTFATVVALVARLGQTAQEQTAQAGTGYVSIE